MRVIKKRTSKAFPMTASMVFFKELEQNRHNDNNMTTTAWKQQPNDDGLTMTMA